jgi:hypothetical protein
MSQSLNSKSHRTSRPPYKPAHVSVLIPSCFPCFVLFCFVDDTTTFPCPHELNYYGGTFTNPRLKNHLIICCLVHMLPSDRKKLLLVNGSSHDLLLILEHSPHVLPCICSHWLGCASASCLSAYSAFITARRRQHLHQITTHCFPELNPCHVHTGPPWRCTRPWEPPCDRRPMRTVSRRRGTPRQQNLRWRSENRREKGAGG